MNSCIQAICFDVGGTLRVTQKNEGSGLEAIRELQSFVGEGGDLLEFRQKIRRREKVYRAWCQKTLVELSEADLWSRFMLPDHPAQFIRENGVRLNQMWRAARNKTLLPDAVHTLRTLAQRGYALAVISNTTSSVEAPQMLEENGIEGLFSTVILSTVFGRRKPHPSLFLCAARELGIRPEHCAYVGDSLSRDLVGARQAGFGGVVIINVNGYQTDEYDPDDAVQKEAISEMQPDFRVGRLSELLEIFPRLEPAARAEGVAWQPPKTYDAALSTMWGVDQAMPFNDTFAAARSIGFTRFELNHKVSPELYRQMDANRFYIATVHDPCPAQFSYEEMKRSDRLISSLDEARRVEAVDSIKRSIDLAGRLGSASVVVHTGTVRCDHSLDARLRELFRQGLRATPQYLECIGAMKAERARLAAPHLERVVKSLEEVIAFARGAEISIGLENRYRYDDIPLPDEMEVLLGLCAEDWWGFQYDSGHAHALHALGLVDGAQWLERFGARMVGVHLHDVKGITDHQVPGQGEVDFREIARHIPAGAQRTLEIGPQASLEEIAAGLEVLAACGCIPLVAA